MNENKTPDDQKPSKAIPWDVHFRPTVIQPGETAALTDMPQVLFRGQKMLAYTNDDDGALDDLHMQAFFVGKKSQMPTRDDTISFRRIAQGITAKEFCGARNGFENGFDTCEQALSLTVQVINRGSIPRVARLLIMGIAVR
jgi:hypothetical protein